MLLLRSSLEPGDSVDDNTPLGFIITDLVSNFDLPPVTPNAPKLGLIKLKPFVIVFGFHLH